MLATMGFPLVTTCVTFGDSVKQWGGEGCRIDEQSKVTMCHWMIGLGWTQYGRYGTWAGNIARFYH